MANQLDVRCKHVLEELDMCKAEEVISVKALTGGVASDIAAVKFGSTTACVKFALEKLQVEEDWFAPVHRSKAEYAWLEFAAKVAPNSIPKLYGWSEKENGFAMEFVSGSGIYLWKTNLLDGKDGKGEAKAVANAIGQIHAVSTNHDFDNSKFQNRDDFDALRIDPYLRFMISQHPDITGQLNALCEGLYNSSIGLVHGDLSPKNILIKEGCPIILDAECATMGDPCFDVAFCMNHLMLKSFHCAEEYPNKNSNLQNNILEFWNVYKSQITWENADNLEARVCALLPALMLARVDGKSPVEYLSNANRDKIRVLAKSLIIQPTKKLKDLLYLTKLENFA